MSVRIDLTKVEAFRDLPSWFQWDFRSRRFGDASFNSQGQGWILLEELLLHTADGGKSWRFVEIHRPPGLLPKSVCADGADSCWLALSQTGSNRPTRIPVINWGAGELSSVTWAGATNGWYTAGSFLVLAGCDQVLLIAVESVNRKESGVILSKESGGTTWQIRARMPGVPTRAFFLDRNVGWLLVHGHAQERERAFRVVLEEAPDEELLLGGHCFSILSTRDGGSTWVAATNVESDLFGIVGVDKYVHAFGCGGIILRSADRGLTWHRVRSRTRSDIHAMGLNSVGLGLAVGDEGAILFSDDGGGSWTRVEHDLKDISFHGVHFSDERSGVIIEPRGIYRFALH